MDNIMKKVAAFIVDQRLFVYIAFAIAVIYSVMSINKVKVNSDITAFLPDETETRRGLNIMEDEFITYATADVMISNITYDAAEALSDQIKELDDVVSVTFDNSAEHYANSAALISISFHGESLDENVIEAMEKVEKVVEGYDFYVNTEIGSDYQAQLAEEINSVLVVVMIIIVLMLTFTSRSYFEVVIFLIVFGVAALLNMGTNYWLGEISSITKSIAVILQLALAIDYAIIFCHRYQDEAATGISPRKAVINSLSTSIIEISSSSLTTISGLVALTLMQFKLGKDLGIVLSKGIICSMLTVFLLMPGLIMLFPKALKRTEHKNLVPSIRAWGNFLSRRKWIFIAFFVALLPVSILYSSKADYVFSEKAMDKIRLSDTQKIANKIADNFEQTTTIAVIVPSGNYNYEHAILDEVLDIDTVRTATGLSNIEVGDDGDFLTDSFTPRMFAELLDLDVDVSRLMFSLYGYENDQYQPIFGDADEYAVPLIDMFDFMFEKIDQGVVTLDDEQQEDIDELRETLEMGEDQLRGENYSRMVFTAAVPIEGDEAEELLEQMHTIVAKYYGDDGLVTGDITSSHDLSESFMSDNTKINVLTALFVFIIIIFTFKSVGVGVLLITVIQGSIWMNFSIPYMTDTNLFFLTNIIVSAIQMGATIDYAIVLTNRYLELKKSMPQREAIATAVDQSFPTILTSGSILIASGFLIALLTTDAYVGSIGLALGRGSLISVILVLTVLPQIIYVCDPLIEKTRFQINLKAGGDENEN
jgi:predicted RND superfamily exporter protein